MPLIVRRPKCPWRRPRALRVAPPRGGWSCSCRRGPASSSSLGYFLSPSATPSTRYAAIGFTPAGNILSGPIPRHRPKGGAGGGVPEHSPSACRESDRASGDFPRSCPSGNWQNSFMTENSGRRWRCVIHSAQSPDVAFRHADISHVWATRSAERAEESADIGSVTRRSVHGPLASGHVSSSASRPMSGRERLDEDIAGGQWCGVQVDKL